MMSKKSKKITNNCLICGSSFDVFPSRSHVKYCSDQCRNEGRSKSQVTRVTKTCGFCGCEYSVSLYHSKNSKYCSRKCQVKDPSKVRKPYPGKSKSVIAKCLMCDVEFKTTERRISQGKSKYCSQKCHYENRSFNTKKSKLVECLVCGKKFKVFNYQKNRQHCSLECRSVSQINATFHPCPNCGKEVRQRAAAKINRRSVYCSTSCRSIHTKTGIPRPDSSERMAGKNNPMYGRSPVHPKPIIYIDKYGRELKLKSTYEERFIKVLESVDFFFCYEPLRFVMEDRTYKPDFYVPALGGFIETKGWVRDEHHKLMDEFRSKYGLIGLVGKNSLELAECDFKGFINSLPDGFCKSVNCDLKTDRLSG